MTPRRLIVGDIVTPQRVLTDGALLVEGEKILDVLDSGAVAALPAELPREDHRRKVIFPGGIDAHVHSFSDPGETFEASTKAAVAGGVTTIIDMPYDVPDPITTPELLATKIDLIGAQATGDVALHGTVAPGSNGSQILPLVNAGVCGFKVSMFETDRHRFPRLGMDELRESLLIGREAGVTIGVHAEDGEIIGALVASARAAGRTAPIDHCLTRPTESETVAVAAAVALAAATRAPFHIFHASTPETVALLSAARAAGADVTAETCPHYLVLDESMMDDLGALGKINPPLRSPAQVERNWQLLASGGYTMVTSDHAPWPREKKTKPNIFDNSSGAPGVQTILPLILGRGWLEGRLSLLRCAEILAQAPAERFNLGHRKGALKPGMDADYVVFDPSGRTTITAETQYSRAGWTPYEGWTLAGSIERTVVRGATVYSDGQVQSSPGFGCFIEGKAA